VPRERHAREHPLQRTVGAHARLQIVRRARGATAAAAGVARVLAPHGTLRPAGLRVKKINRSHTHTHRQRRTPPTHTHAKSNTPNPQTNNPHKHLTTLDRSLRVEYTGRGEIYWFSFLKTCEDMCEDRYEDRCEDSCEDMCEDTFENRKTTGEARCEDRCEYIAPSSSIWAGWGMIGVKRSTVHTHTHRPRTTPPTHTHTTRTTPRTPKRTPEDRLQ